ncbi:hypothetical protein FACS189459_2170 [Bacilli bacterium]|nr:hypothetical protein FACS189459_2170 [Bacilli bacterium]
MDNPIDFNRIGEVFEKANSTPSSSVVTDGEDTEKNPELYIFKDKNALINRMNYILQLYWNNAFQNKDGYSDISNVNFKDYKYLSSNEIK